MPPKGECSAHPSRQLATLALQLLNPQQGRSSPRTPTLFTHQSLSPGVSSPGDACLTQANTPGTNECLSGVKTKRIWLARYSIRISCPSWASVTSYNLIRWKIILDRKGANKQNTWIVLFQLLPLMNVKKTKKPYSNHTMLHLAQFTNFSYFQCSDYLAIAMVNSGLFKATFIADSSTRTLISFHLSPFFLHWDQLRLNSIFKYLFVFNTMHLRPFFLWIGWNVPSYSLGKCVWLMGSVSSLAMMDSKMTTAFV